MKKLLSRKDNLKDAAKVALGGIAVFTVMKLFTTACMVFSINLILSLIMLVTLVISLMNGKQFKKRCIVLSIIFIIVLMSIRNLA